MPLASADDRQQHVLSVDKLTDLGADLSDDTCNRYGDLANRSDTAFQFTHQLPLRRNLLAQVRECRGLFAAGFEQLRLNGEDPG